MSEFAVGDLVEFVEEVDGIKEGTRANVVRANNQWGAVDLYDAVDKGGRRSNLFYYVSRFKKVHRYDKGDKVRYTGPVEEVVGTEMVVSSVTLRNDGQQYLRGKVTKAVEANTWFGVGRPISFRESEAEPVVEPEPPFAVGDTVEFVEYYGTRSPGDKGKVTKVEPSNPDLGEGAKWLITLEYGDNQKATAFERRLKLADPEPPFKVGDKVRIPASENHGWGNTEGVVTEIRDSQSMYNVTVLVNKAYISFYFHELELLPEEEELAEWEKELLGIDTEPATPTFKVGDWVEVIQYNGIAPEQWIGAKGQVTEIRPSRYGSVAHVVTKLETDGRDRFTDTCVLAAYKYKKIDAPAPKLWTEQAEVGTYGYTLSVCGNKIGRILHKLEEDRWTIQYPHDLQTEAYTIGVTEYDNDGVAFLMSEEDFIQIS